MGFGHSSFIRRIGHLVLISLPKGDVLSAKLFGLYSDNKEYKSDLSGYKIM